MGGQRRVGVLVAVGAAALWGASCGAGAGAPGGGRDGGGAGQTGGSGDAQCPSSGGLTAEPAPRQVAFDGGVPIDQLAQALAVARCNYLSRCFALSTYVANECVDAIATNESWGYQVCGPNNLGFGCISTTAVYSFPSAALLQAVAAGLVHYDPQQEAQCIAALLAEGCASNELLEEIPACVGIFTCASAADGGDAGPTDGGGADGGSACSQLVSPNPQPLQTCATDDDCAGLTAYPQGPDCVAGICAASRCGITFAACSSFAAVGQSCSSNAFSILNDSVTPEGMCAPGLACQGRTADGGLGTCVVPVDVGGTCTDDSNCKPGLACACGTCEIPPSTGPCVNGLCEVGVAYCDSGSNTCHPVRQSGASCAGAINSCAPGVICSGGLCEPPS